MYVFYNLPFVLAGPAIGDNRAPVQTNPIKDDKKFCFLVYIKFLDCARVCVWSTYRQFIGSTGIKTLSKYLEQFIIIMAANDGKLKN